MVSTQQRSVIPEQLSDLLESKALAHVATIGPKGEPQVNPVWFGWDGTYLRFTQTTPQQRARNLERDPRIAVSIVDPTNPYRRLEIRGRAVAFEPDPELAFINGMAKKYLGQDTYPWHNRGDTWVVVVVEPKHTTQMG